MTIVNDVSETLEALKQSASSNLPAAPLERGYQRKAVVFGVAGAALLAGLVYLVIEFKRTGVIVDSLFVSMLVGATVLLLFGMRSIMSYVERRGVDFYTFVLASADPKEAYLRHIDLCLTISSPARMTVCGAIYGVVVGSAPYILNVWPGQSPLRMALALFLFCVNFVTGVAFYSLLRFFIFSTKMGTQVRVDLWQTSDPSTDFLTDAARRIALLSSAYVSLCLSSILFSVLPLHRLVVAYSAFSALVLTLSIIIPSVPLANRLRASKTAAVRELDERIQIAFLEVTAAKSDGIDSSLARLQSLLGLRDKVDGLNSWPFKVKSAMSAISVLLFSAIPVVLQVFLERLIK